jgi:hypothetical protein
MTWSAAKIFVEFNLPKTKQSQGDYIMGASDIWA